MFKKLVHKLKNKDGANDGAPETDHPHPWPQQPVSYASTAGAVVDYRQSAPTVSVFSNMTSPAPISYIQSPPSQGSYYGNSNLAPPQGTPSALTSPTPIDYNMSPPPAVVPVSGYAPQTTSNKWQPYPLPAELPGEPHLAELPTTPHIQVNVVKTPKAPRVMPLPSPKTPGNEAPKFPSPDRASPATARSWSDAETLVGSPRPPSNYARRDAPGLIPATVAPTPITGSSQSGHGGQPEPGVTKFTVEIFCQRKASTATNPGQPRREELPRDIREFRLAKLAMIQVEAGGRTYVSLDVVFGEADKGIAAILEKHFLVMPGSQLSKAGGAVNNEGPKTVWQISPLRGIAWSKQDSLLYVAFKSPDDESAFIAKFNTLQPLAHMDD